MEFARFMASAAGRGLRIVVGAVLIGWGIAAGNWILDAIGAVAFLSGALNVCGLAPLLGGPFRGNDARQS